MSRLQAFPRATPNLGTPHLGAPPISGGQPAQGFARLAPEPTSAVIIDRPLLAEVMGQDGHKKILTLLMDALVVWVIIIHTTAPVSFFSKITHGQHASWIGLFWLSGAVGSLVIAGMHPLRSIWTYIKIMPFALLNIWLVMSTLWSISPYDTLRGGIFITASHLAFIGMAVNYSWEKILCLLTTALGIVVVTSVFLAIAIPSLGQMQEIHVGAWCGLWGEKQMMGLYACHFITTIVALIAYDYKKYGHLVILLVIAVAAILGATGRTAMVMTVAACATMPLVWLVQRGARQAIVVSSLGLFGGIALGAFAVTSYTTFLKLLGRGTDFTGRTEVWREVNHLIDRNPMFGYGYQAVWRTQTSPTSPYQWIAEGANFEPQNAHSSWLDAQLALGWPGLILLIASVVMAWVVVVIKSPTDKNGGMFAMATMVALTTISFTESTFLNHMDLQWALVVLVTAKLLTPDMPRKPKNDIIGRLDDDGYVFRSIDKEPTQRLRMGP